MSHAYLSTDDRVLSFNSIPQKHVDGRSLELSAGNSLGGSTKINGMLYTRGLPGEYNAWSKAGRQGWSYSDLLAYFTMSETDLDQKSGSPDEYHGIQGMSCFL